MTAFIITILVISVLNVGISLAYIAVEEGELAKNLATIIVWGLIAIWAIVLL